MKEQLERVYILMARKVAGEISAKELAELETLLTQHPGLQYTFSMTSELAPLPRPESPATADELARKTRGQHKLDELLSKEEPAMNDYNPLQNQPRRIFRLPVWAVAASAILLAGIGVLIAKRNTNTPSGLVETAHGNSKTEVRLPDGTVVTLNAGSRLRYDSAALLAGTREVSLEGEGFFNVKADPQHPFIIKTGKVDIKVLGTTFNLKAYPGDKQVETYLYTGKVEVTYKHLNKDKAVVLHPKERLVINLPALEQVSAAAPDKQVKDIVRLVTPKAEELQTDSIAAPGWMQGRLEFEDVTFEQLANDLERRYNIKIDIRNEQLRKERFTGSFNQKPLPDILQALRYTLQFTYNINESQHQVEIW
ncbi:FecR family protein [Chitinophaga barathri]|uniref:DUF4974 domain-containing protein n=1 Tax=Chitinophaga barathri TaxID=1647451 RepID=A0A3N4MFX9_9BACT|nr:FecR domain-containing protein [Chitinophaga barathri]RPD42864.1 DUF4974 domain-containing protein [Chitinophaga barathri]